MTSVVFPVTDVIFKGGVTAVVTTLAAALFASSGSCCRSLASRATSRASRRARIAGSRSESMLPPETMQTSCRPGTWPESAAATASAPAPSAITRARSASSRTAAAVSSSDDRVGAREQRRERVPTSRAAATFAPAPSTNDGAVARPSLGSPAASAAATARARLGLARRTTLRRRAAAPRARSRSRSKRPPPPQGTSTASTSGRSSSELEPDRAVAGHHARRPAPGARRSPRLRRTARSTIDLPPALVRHLDDRAAEPLDRVELRLRARGRARRPSHGTPSSRAAQATPCAMLPALAVTTPSRESRRRAPAGSRWRRRGS